MRVYFVRHGQSQANLLRIVSNRGLHHPLTAEGRRQAQALAGRLAGLAARHGPILRVYASPVLRALETGLTIAHRLGVGYEPVEALREFDCGLAEGQADPAAWASLAWVTDEWAAGRRASRIEGGESFEDMQARFAPFVAGLAAAYGRRPVGVVCVGHGGLFRAMLPLVLCNLSAGQMAERRLAYTACIQAELRPEGLACAAWDGEEFC